MLKTHKYNNKSRCTVSNNMKYLFNEAASGYCAGFAFAGTNVLGVRKGMNICYFRSLKMKYP